MNVVSHNKGRQGQNDEESEMPMRMLEGARPRILYDQQPDITKSTELRR